MSVLGRMEGEGNNILFSVSKNGGGWGCASSFFPRHVKTGGGAQTILVVYEMGGTGSFFKT